MTDYKSIIGHEKTIEFLKNSIAADKVSHAYIFDGEDYSGKSLLAGAFAMSLQCEAGGSEPCGECHSCKQAQTDNHPDIIWLDHEKPGSVGVDDIRKLNGNLLIKPYSGRYKIYIIREAEKMTDQAQNALLKTIEEPPEYAVIIMLTNNYESFLPTIRSRCVRVSLEPVSNDVLIKFLREQQGVNDYQARICAAFAQGNVGKALKLAQSEEFNQMKDEVLRLVKNIKRMEQFEVLSLLHNITEYKLSIYDFLDMIMVWYRDVLLFKATSDANGLIFKDELSDIRHQANESSYQGIEAILESLEKAKVRIRANVNFDLVVELLFLAMREN
ncbi:MAG: DNA polymerase III subunit delta' [Lachnospiraceae bacterium]|nr:DNA polymerase III subunit delta' [Lachnospiraceae bacterium]